jgi:hypothetical protein
VERRLTLSTAIFYHPRYGVMEQTQSNGTWFIGSTASSTGQTTTLTVSRARLAGQFWAYNTLECYGCVVSCSIRVSARAVA